MNRPLAWLAGAIVAVSWLALFVPIAAHAYTPPTAAEIEACTPDAWRLCAGQVIWGRAAVFRCMKANKAKLSAACRAVFAAHGL
jgi:hypothetical protein